MDLLLLCRDDDSFRLLTTGFDLGVLELVGLDGTEDLLLLSMPLLLVTLVLLMLLPLILMLVLLPLILMLLLLTGEAEMAERFMTDWDLCVKELLDKGVEVGGDRPNAARGAGVFGDAPMGLAGVDAAAVDRKGAVDVLVKGVFCGVATRTLDETVEGSDFLADKVVEDADLAGVEAALPALRSDCTLGPTA